MTGSIQVKNGKYYAVINLYDCNGKRKNKWISTNLDVKGNKRKAEQFLRDKIKEYESKANLCPTETLFCDYIKQWLDTAKLKIEESTYQSYLFIANAHIIPYFKDRKTLLSDLSRNDIQQYINDKFNNGRLDGKGGLSAKTVKAHLVLIKQALKEAVKNNYINVNPSDYVTIPKIQKFEAGFYSVDELNKMLNLIKDDIMFPLVYFTAVFGLRRSEVLGLKWDSIDFDNRTITIKHTVVRISVEIEKDSTKNQASYRSYPIDDTVLKILHFLKSKEAENRTLFGKEYIENEYIFKWDNGSTFKPDYVSHHFKELLTKNNLRVIRFHDLRHSCASLLIANGFTLKDIQEWLGHSDIQTTANIYAHLDIERKNKISSSMTSSLLSE